jgi:hypothetical protein
VIAGAAPGEVAVQVGALDTRVLLVLLPLSWAIVQHSESVLAIFYNLFLLLLSPWLLGYLSWAHAPVPIAKALAQLAIIVGSLIITNVLVPEYVARWRGANLLYPAQWRLWLGRLVWSAALAGLCWLVLV